MEHPTYGNTLGSSACATHLCQVLTYYFRATPKTQNFLRLIYLPWGARVPAWRLQQIQITSPSLAAIIM